MGELIKTIKQLNEKNKRCIYALVAGGELFAYTTKTDIDGYLKSEESIITPYTDLNEVSLLYGFQMDIEELPFEFESAELKKKHLWLLVGVGDSVMCERCQDLKDLTDMIEEYLVDYPEADITDFAAILGDECDLVVAVESAGSYIHENTVYK